MKRILQAMDGVATKPVAGANDMARFLRAVTEADINQEVVEDEVIDNGDGSTRTNHPDGTYTISDGGGITTYDAQGTVIKHNSPSFAGYSQSTDSKGQVTKNFNQGPMSIQQGPQGTTANYQLGDKNLQTTVKEDSLSKFLSIIDKNNVSILNEGANPHKVSLPVQMAMQHYQKPQEPIKTVGRNNTFGKYFHKVEQEVNEAVAEEQAQKRQLINQYASVIAERVLMKEAANPAQQAAIAISKKKEQQADESLKSDNPCWKGYHPVGTKKKGGRTVPNCVPTNENEIPGHSMGFTGGVGPGIQSSVAETPLELDRDNPMASMVHSHQGANPGSIEYRIMRARRQLQDLAKQAESDSPLVWQHIARLFPELAMNIEQINHGLGELKNIRSKGGKNSKNIPALESVLPTIKPKTIKPKAKTSVCKAGQVQTGMQTKDGKSVPKCSVTKK